MENEKRKSGPEAQFFPSAFLLEKKTLHKPHGKFNVHKPNRKNLESFGSRLETLVRIALLTWLRDRALNAGPPAVGADLPDIDGPVGRPHRQGSALPGRQGADRTCGREAEGRGGVACSSAGMGLCDPIVSAVNSRQDIWWFRMGEILTEPWLKCGRLIASHRGRVCVGKTNHGEEWGGDCPTPSEPIHLQMKLQTHSQKSEITDHSDDNDNDHTSN